MRPPSCLALLAAVLAPVVVLSGGGASAQTAAPTPSPTATPTSPVAPRLVVVRDADSGGRVVLVPGQLLRVELGAAAEPWQGLEASTAGLQLTGYDAAASGLGASLEALAPAPPQTLVATAGSRRWELTVEVGPGDARAPRTCAPSPTAAPTGTPAASPTAVPSASATPRPGLELRAGSDGGSYRVREDDPVFVGLTSCSAPFGPVVVSGPLVRQQAGSSVSDGSAEANLVPRGAGTATLTAERDAPCASRPGATCPAPWRVVLTIESSCALTLTGPATVPAGGTASLAGTARPGEVVSVLFRRRGETAFTVRRTLTAGPDGAFSTSFAAVDDHRYQAVSGRCSTAPALVQVQPTVAAPARVARGTTAVVDVRAAAGSRVEVLFRRAGSTVWRTGRTGTADTAGRFRTAFRPDVDHAVAASSLGRRSAPRVVQAR